MRPSAGNRFLLIRYRRGHEKLMGGNGMFALEVNAREDVGKKKRFAQTWAVMRRSARFGFTNRSWTGPGTEYLAVWRDSR